jgi:hypothetical protein
MYKIIDNFLSKEEHENILKIITCYSFPWFLSSFVAKPEEKNDFFNSYMFHKFYDYREPKLNLGMNIHYNNDPLQPGSEFMPLLNTLIDKIEYNELYRVKGNLYFWSENLNYHTQHIDYECSEIKGAVYYVNSNNGYTVLEDGTKIESISNRILFFDSSKPHNSTNCTNEKYRITINLNYK